MSDSTVSATMQANETFVLDQPDALATPHSSRRPLVKVLMHWIRRGHLYFGLFLFPWAVLYGVTAFLFNHPAVFSDVSTAAFGKESLTDTPLESLPTPQEQAAAVVAALNEKQQPTVPYKLVGDAKYTGREFAFATAKADGQSINVLIDVKNGSGTIRSTANAERKKTEKAPFAVGSDGPGAAGKGGAKGAKGGRGAKGSSDGIKIEQSLHERVKAAVPLILQRHGFAIGDVTVTSVPQIVFPIEVDGTTWSATYNPMTGSVSGTPEDVKPESEMSFRRFLLRLHTAHGYPGETNARWFWAVIVDVMAIIMCFWGFSGLLMWWQIKATRALGFVILLVSAVAAVTLGIAMHSALTS